MTLELETAIQAALKAGDLLRSEFNRPEGPRGSGDHAEVDEPAERLIFEYLTSAFPTYGYLGEELGSRKVPSNADELLWVVDPNDGTSAYLKGFRGAAVSIALLRRGEPVLGVVYAYNFPDDDGDLITWAEGGPVRRNGSIVRRTWPDRVTPDCTALISQSADCNARANAEIVAPMRYRAVPSIAYRLALVAAGEGDVGVSLNEPTTWDLAAGHALPRGAGAELYDYRGEPIRYSARGECDNTGDVFGGAEAVVRNLVGKSWNSVFRRPQSQEHVGLLWPAKGGGPIAAGKLARAQGCLLGQLAGDALGSLVEFQSPDEIRRDYPNGVRKLADDGVWQTLAGQPTDDSELALVLARSLVAKGTYDQAAVAEAYAVWYRSEPFDMGSTTDRALRAAGNANDSPAEAARRAADPTSQSNGALMRVSPLGIFGANADPARLDDWAAQDAALTHPHPICRQINQLYVRAIAEAVRNGPDPASLYRAILTWADELGAGDAVLAVTRRAAEAPPEDFLAHQGWVLIAWQNALYQLLHAPSLEDGVVDTIGRGGDTDTNAAICGALLGAVYGRKAIPAAWLNRLLTCRPIQGLPGVCRPRPACYWPVDALIVAERLLSKTRQAKVSGG
jgi:ADP-ribosyl-[dinitrogen reductase] hydrolase